MPSKFPNCPSYLSTPQPEDRGTAATSSSRQERQAERAEAAAEAFLTEDEIRSLSDLKSKLDRTCLPSGVTEVWNDQEALFFGLRMDAASGPVISYCVAINSDMALSLYCQGIKLPIQQVAHISGKM